MEIKLFEVRDRMTFIPVIAVKLAYRDAAERYLLRSAGYTEEQIRPNLSGIKVIGGEPEPYVLLTRLEGGECNYDPYKWTTGARTLPAAHRYIIDRWDMLATGEVVDVEFIHGEKPTPKQSESQTI
ncbi:MAG TPA: hypothetical protein VM531_08960 [Sphingomicrobium sp.]|jgi:hypothetical protein|nr:hypothetical protein [Sphingomicrobium sp.]